MSKTYDAFISYSRSDGAEYADAIKKELLSKGYSVFVDQELLGGTSLPEQLEEVLGHSRFVIVILSRAAAQSHWVQDEVAFALRRSKRVIPIILDPSALDSPVGSLIADRASLDAKGTDPKLLVQEILRSIDTEKAYSNSKRRLSLFVKFGAAIAAVLFLISLLYFSYNRYPNLRLLMLELRESRGSSKEHLENFSLSRANLRKMDLSGITLRNAILVESDLSEARLQNADLRGSLLVSARMSGVIATDANFSYSKMIDANLSHANLRGALFLRTDLRLANLSYANLQMADLRGAILRDIICEGALFEGAKFDRTTVLPACLNLQRAGMVYVESK